MSVLKRSWRRCCYKTKLLGLMGDERIAEHRWNAKYAQLL
jgi:hypothetical protein